MRRRSSILTRRRRPLAAAILALFLGVLAILQLLSGGAPPPPPISHRAASASPKIAFLFIARNRIPLDLVWDAFLEGDGEGRFSVYVHSRPGFVLHRATTRSRFFYGRQINNSVEVDWGASTMVEAERILLGAALEDHLNARFVFLSDSCIPLYNFSYIYEYIMSSPNSFVDSFADTKEGRYNPRMSSVIPFQNWRKGSQWVVLTRKHAEVVVNDDVVFPIFQRHCKRRPLPEFWREHRFPADVGKLHNCIPDEHYVQTLLAQNELEWEITPRSLTHSSWDLSSSKYRERSGWHPVTYKFSEATPRLIKGIKGTNNIYFETEKRKEWCTNKGKPSKCFLFARKFTRPAALRLLNSSALGIR